MSKEGYGTVWTGESNRKAHKVIYEREVGPVPQGMTLDHLCHTEAEMKGECDGGWACPHRACVNVEHLEPVTFAENVNRGSSPGMRIKRSGVCKRKHPLVEPNLVRGTGSCRACAQARAHVHHHGGDVGPIADQKYEQIVKEKK
jgi:hypothetical protein